MQKKILLLIYSILIVTGLLFQTPSSYADELPMTENEEPGSEEYSAPEPVFYRAIVIEEPVESIVPGYLGESQSSLIRQHVPLRFITGPEKGTEMSLDFDVRPEDIKHGRLEINDKVIVGLNMVAGEDTYYISDIYRLNALWILLAVFTLLILVLARWSGVRALAGLVISYIVIMKFLLPNMEGGENTIMVALLSTLLIATVSIFIAHGFRSRTTIAFISTVLTIFISLFVSLFLTDVMHLFGLGSEEAFFLQSSEQAFNIRGILIAGIIIGTLGVLDDITTAQSAVVEELHHANPLLSAKELFRRGSSVGREHIISLVNTLILAYTGASLPLLLLFQIYERPTWLILNSEIIMEEIVRMLVGSIALVLAVPLTTYIASRYYGRKNIVK